MEIIAFYDHIIRESSGESNLREWAEFLFQDSLDCIGLLQSWLRDALAIASATGPETLTKAHLMEAKLSASDRRIIEEEILEGEATMARMEND